MGYVTLHSILFVMIAEVCSVTSICQADSVTRIKTAIMDVEIAAIPKRKVVFMKFIPKLR